jgi:hypothetical protein
MKMGIEMTTNFLGEPLCHQFLQPWLLVKDSHRLTESTLAEGVVVQEQYFEKAKARSESEHHAMMRHAEKTAIPSRRDGSWEH